MNKETMKTEQYKYIVSIEGVMDNMTFTTFEDAMESIKQCLPHGATITPIEVRGIKSDITKEEIIKESKIIQAKTGWRFGQSVFNFLDEEYHVARNVQFKDGIDCFYRDDQVDNFIEAALEYLNKNK